MRWPVPSPTARNEYSRNRPNSASRLSGWSFSER
ncbi:EspF repeat-containing protein [Celerinatantimonas sp. MCCC 1A17872]